MKKIWTSPNNLSIKNRGSFLRKSGHLWTEFYVYVRLKPVVDMSNHSSARNPYMDYSMLLNLSSVVYEVPECIIT